MKQKRKVYYYRGVWYDSDLNELVHDNQFNNATEVILDDAIDIVSLYHSNFFEDMHGMTAEQFIASDQYEVFI